MIRLFAADLKRFLSRRAVRATGALALLAILFAAFLVFINSSKDPGAVQLAEEMRAQEVQSCVEGNAGHAPEGYDSPEEFCEDVIQVADPRFHLREMEEVLQGMSFLLVIIAIGLGATFVGAEWGAGTMTTLLTWEPRRSRVWMMRVLAGAVFVFILTMLVQALLVLALAPVAAVRGTLEGVDAAWMWDTTIVGLKSALVCSLMAIVGMSIAMISRVTAAAVIISFIYFAVIENLIRGFRPNWTRWLPGDNLAIYVFGSEGASLQGGFEPSETRALVTLIGYVAIFFIAAHTLFRARDVT